MLKMYQEKWMDEEKGKRDRGQETKGLGGENNATPQAVPINMRNFTEKPSTKENNV